jgi:hypothetical protein
VRTDSERQEWKEVETKLGISEVDCIADGEDIKDPVKKGLFEKEAEIWRNFNSFREKIDKGVRDKVINGRGVTQGSMHNMYCMLLIEAREKGMKEISKSGETCKNVLNAALRLVKTVIIMYTNEDLKEKATEPE